MTPIHILRIAILNRGDAALRFLRAIWDHNADRRHTLQAVAIHTAPDADAPFVQLADDAYSLGPAAVRSDDGTMRSPYQDPERVLAALRATGCDAVWPGWGFASEDPDFVERLEREGIVFVGPSSVAMRRLADKIEAKRLAESCGVPLAPWRELPSSADATDILAAAAEVGYPLMIKAAGGGGGRGIRRVDDPDGVVDAAAAVRSDALRLGGGVLLERCVQRARHVEVQFLVGADGRAATFGVRDCSLQRRHQKVIEESPSPVLSPLEEADLCASTERMAVAAGYRGVGTAEFLFDPATRSATFLEVNARLQVEHTITELVWGVDLVRAQIDTALGLPVDPPTGGPRGWAFEARLCAEDPDQGFQPAPGVLQVFRPPAGPQVRVDTGVREGSEITADFDSLLAKICVWGATRGQALASLERALRECEVLVADGATTRGFLIDVVRNPAVTQATATTTWIEQALAAGELGQPRHAFDALLVAAVVRARASEDQSVQRFLTDSQLGRPVVERRTGPTMELRLRGTTVAVAVHHLGRNRYRCRVDGVDHEVSFEPAGRHAAVLHRPGKVRRVLYAQGRSGVVVDIEGALHRVERIAGGELRAPGPALVVDLLVASGDRVDVGDPVCVLEAMKTETTLYANTSGVVDRVLCGPAQQVGSGQVLVVVRPDGHEGSSATPSPGPAFGAGELGIAPLAELPAEQLVERVLAVALGFDAPDDLVDELVAALDSRPSPGAVTGRVPQGGSGAPAGEGPDLTDALRAFADIEALFGRELVAIDDATAISPEAAFAELCRHPHQGLAVVAAPLRPVVAAALGHYGVDPGGPGDHLGPALWRMAATRRQVWRRHRVVAAATRTLGRNRERLAPDTDLAALLDRVGRLAAPSEPYLCDAARAARALVTPGSVVLDRWAGHASGASTESPDAAARRLAGARYIDFDLEPLDREGSVLCVRATSRTQPDDERLLVIGEVLNPPPDLRHVSPDELDDLSRTLADGLTLLRRHQEWRSARDRVRWIEFDLHVQAPMTTDTASLLRMAQEYDADGRGLGIQVVTVRLTTPRPVRFVLTRPTRDRLEVATEEGPEVPVRPLGPLEQRALRSQRLGVTDPWQIVRLLAGEFRPAPHPAAAEGEFREYDFDEGDTPDPEADTAGRTGAFGPVDRAWGNNTAGVVVGLVTNRVPGRTEPVERVLIASDPLHSMGALGLPECRRIDAAIALAAERGVPVDWVAVSSGARISMDSGTENLDATARVLRRIVSHTDAGGVINVVVAGTCVGAQSYWHAEAAMLMHTRGALIMVEDGSMVLTGRKALEVSGGVVADSEIGLGGHDRIMGPNGESQLRAATVTEAICLLFDLHGRWVASGRPTETGDPPDRSVLDAPYDGVEGFATVGEIFDDRTNPGRKRPFAIRPVMSAVADRDIEPLERWRDQRDAGGVVVWDTRIGGWPTTLIGIESRPVDRVGTVPLDGPNQWAGGTLYPHGSRKLARALNQASGNRPAVVLANLSGFDGSPESLRRRQLEYGAEIARAVVRFDGPIVFVVISRYHGGAYVVFSKELNPNLTALAVEGSFASVIGGAPAAEVVFARDARRRAAQTPEVRSARAAVEAANPTALGPARERWAAVRAEAERAAKSAIAAEFDGVHTVRRAVEVGSLDAVIPAHRLRPAIIEILGSRLQVATTPLGPC